MDRAGSAGSSGIVCLPERGNGSGCCGKPTRSTRMLAAFFRACTFPSDTSSNESASLGSGGSRVDAAILAGSEADSNKIVDWDLEAPGLPLAGTVFALLTKSALSFAVGRVGKNGVACGLNLNGVTASLSPAPGNPSGASGCSFEEVLLLTCVSSPLNFAVLLK